MVGGVTYARYRDRDRRPLGIPTMWVAVEPGPEAPRYAGFELPSLTPAGVLEHFTAGPTGLYRSVERVGVDSVEGVRTTRYSLRSDPAVGRAELVQRGLSPSLARLVDALVTTDVWVDDFHRLRRTRVVIDQTIPLGDFRARIVVDQVVLRYTTSAPSVVAPPADEVTWMSATELSGRFSRLDPFVLVQ